MRRDNGNISTLLTMTLWRIYRNIWNLKIAMAIIASIALGIGHGYLDGLRFSQVRNEYVNLQKSNEANFEKAATYSQILPSVVARPNPNSIICGNARDLVVGAAVLRGILGQPIFYNPYTLDNPYLYFAVSGGFGGSILLLHALFALALTYNSVSTDTRISAVRLLFSFGISRLAYLFAEWLAAVVTMLIPLVIGLIVFIVAAGTAGAEIKIFSTPIVGLILLSLCITSAYAWLGLWLSASMKSSHSALTLAVVIWACTTWLLPSLASETARLIQPINNDINAKLEGPSFQDSIIVASLPTKPSEGVDNWTASSVQFTIEGYYSKQSLNIQQRNMLTEQFKVYEILCISSPIAYSQLSLASICEAGENGARDFIKYCLLQNDFLYQWQREHIKRDPQRFFVKTGTDDPLDLNGLENIQHYASTSSPVRTFVVSFLPLIIWNTILAIGSIISFNKKSLVQTQ